jgi:hypothetical protein
MRATTTSLWVLLAAFSGCGPATGRGPDKSGPGNGGNGGSGGEMGSGDIGDMAWPSVDSNQPQCDDSAKLVYLLDADGSLWSFQPNQMDITKSKLTSIGPLKCSTTMQPNSMSVDRTGTAWVEYVPMDETDTTNDQLFKVNVTTAACTATSYKSSSFGTHYGMGFVADAPMSTAESLFVAKGDAPYKFGKFDTTALTITTLGTPNGGPELSGTGDAKLWAFFPDASMPRVSELDKTNGAEGKSYPVSGAAGVNDGYAFAFWGGDFWVFLKKDTDTYSVLYHVRGSDGAVDTWTLTGRQIVGAGVSTCAPTTPIG